MVDSDSIVLAGERFSYHVTRSGQRVLLSVPSPGFVDVRVPEHSPIDVLALMKTHKKWIVARHRERVRTARLLPRVCAGGWIWVRGERVLVDEVVPKESLGDGGLAGFKAWYRQQAQKDLAARLDHWSRILGIDYAEFFLSSATTRWGYCTRAGRIGISWRLYQMPPWVIDYVVIHELTHRRYPHHQPNFWEACEKSYPQTRQARRWLRENGAAFVW